jgi:hypothetical protein
MVPKVSHPATTKARPAGVIARTVRFPEALRRRIASDADRCGRSFEAHVIAVLRHHYGEDVDLAPSPDHVLRLSEESFAGLSARDQALVTRRLGR